MASGSSEVTATQEPAETAEECSGKKKSKFQTFKRFFARKKKKEPRAAGADAGLKGSQSSDNVSKTSESNTLTRAEKEKGSGSKISLGSKALSHDSVFVSDSSEANEALGASQDSIHGKVKSLQQQLKQAIKLGSPPSLMCVKRAEDGGAVSEDDGLPCSPPEYAAARHAAAAQRSSGVSLEGADSDDDQLSCGPSSRAVSPLVVAPGDFSQPASPFACLDNSAAKHKRGLRSKACHKRKPISRMEMKMERDSVEEATLDSSTAEAPQEKQGRAEDAEVDELKPQVEADGQEDNKEEAEEEELKKALGDSVLRDGEEEEKEKDGEGEEEEKEKDGEGEEEEKEEVSPGREASTATDTSRRPEPRLSEEDVPPASPGSSSRPSSVDSPRVTPEPPAGPRRASLCSSNVGPAAAAVEEVEEQRTEEQEEEEQQTEEQEEEKDTVETEEKPDRGEETSFLQEVLSSLKTPLESRSLGAESEDVVLEVKEREATGAGAEEENQEVMEEDEEAEEPVGYQAAPDGCPSPNHTAEEEKGEEEEKDEEEGEEVKILSTRVHDEEENVQEEEEEPVAEHSSQCLTEEGEAEETNQPKDESDMPTVNAEVQLENKTRAAEEEESYGEEVKEPEEEGDDEDEGGASEVEEAKDAAEREEQGDEEKDSEEEMMEEPPPSAAAAFAPASPADGKEVETSTGQQEEDEVGGLSVQHLSADNGAVSAEPADQVPDQFGEASSQSFEGEGEEMEEKEEEGEEEEDEQQETGVIEEQVEEHLVREEEGAADRAGEKEVEQEEPVEKCDKATELSDVPIRPPSLILLESNQELPSDVGGATSPSKTRTATLHINLISPSSDKGGAFFQQSPTAAHPTETEEQVEIAGGGGGGGGGGEEDGEEEKQAEVEKERPAGSDEAAEQRLSRPAHNKVRFTIAPAWQRSLSAEGEAKEGLTPPGGVEEEEEVKEVKQEALATIQHDVSAESESEGGASVEPEWAVPGGPPGCVMPQPPPAKAEPPVTATEAAEHSIMVEGNPDNPFGVKLRKTSVLHRFSSEEENSEPQVESPGAPATSSKVESPQPISAKPSVSQPVVSKPALPKKPDLQGDAAGKSKRVSDPPAVRCAPAGSESPSWISMAKQKQKIYKENSLEEATSKKEEQEKKSSVPSYVASAASREKSKETAESSSKVIQPEVSRPPEAAEESRRPLSPLAPLPYHPPKSLPCPVPPKPSQLSATRPPLTSAQRFPPTPVPIPLKSPPCVSPSSLPKPAVSPRTSTSPPQLPSPRGVGLPSSQTPPSQRGLPPPPTTALPQDEPPWMALAKKKAKAWSEMPQIVQ